MSYFVLLASISPSVKTKPKLLMEERRSVSERSGNAPQICKDYKWTEFLELHKLHKMH
jgi:hypothetical protein